MCIAPELRFHIIALDEIIECKPLVLANISRERIVENRIYCSYCGAAVQSLHRHDFVEHSCETMRAWKGDPNTWIAVDGGRDYLRRTGDPGDFIEASVVEIVDE